MADIALSTLSSLLCILIVLSGCFSASETAMLSLNRYRLKHLVKQGHRGAIRAEQLLRRPDRLIGLILLANNFVNILASSIATLIALRLLGEAGIAVATGLLTLVILVFAEVTPKTIAVHHPERIAFPASYVLIPLLWICYPLVWIINTIANGLLYLARIRKPGEGADNLSSEELRTVVNEAGTLIPRRHQKMLLGILDLEDVTVDDIMIPRNEIIGIDIDDDIEKIKEQLYNIQHSRIPVYRESIDNVVGLIHARDMLRLSRNDSINHEGIQEVMRPPYFVPESTTLNSQLLNFQRQKRRTGLVVDEYGDIMGLITLEDILEEIVGEFTTDISAVSKDVHPKDDGTFVIDGSAYIREVNRLMNLDLPTNGPKTINGLILEYLESIPEPGTSLLLAGYPVEILQTTGNAIKTIKLKPERHQKNQ